MIYFALYVLGGLALISVAAIAALLWAIWYLSATPEQWNNVK